MGDMDEVQLLAREVNRITTSSASRALLKALARLEAEHKRLEWSYVPQERVQEMFDALQPLYDKPGQPNTLVNMVEACVADVKRLRADSESLRNALTNQARRVVAGAACWCAEWPRPHDGNDHDNQCSEARGMCGQEPTP